MHEASRLPGLRTFGAALAGGVLLLLAVGLLGERSIARLRRAPSARFS